jgi:hypothetical protein
MRPFGLFDIQILQSLYGYRRHQFHQANLGSAIGTTSIQLTNKLSALTHYLVTKGFSGADATAAAPGYLHQQLQHQVSHAVLHGLLPGGCMADLGRGSAIVFGPAIQAGWKANCCSLIGSQTLPAIRFT